MSKLYLKEKEKQQNTQKKKQNKYKRQSGSNVSETAAHNFC